ncbi:MULTISPECIES: RBBP9/YdeN family alpha/beta hydrolase [Acinetobacter]|uniref:RBBP9/YdeN family alpha/beta hydrolase n=1 Tax=Acinetobacter TaxID=469 RepID=UPI001905F0AC|nr:alpha/beta hydrolase [Acinetobacter sp. TGL-Y2]MBJ9372769.1 serine hydrolase family protein [Acinetobacter sp. TGL-Y2]
MRFIIVVFSFFLLTNAAFAQNNIYIIHGYGANVNDHWFGYIERNISDQNNRVIKIALPDSSRPHLLAWNKTLKDNIPRIDKHTFFVAHSLGCITLLDYLAQSNFQQIGGVVCVSGFSERLKALPQLDGYILATKKDFSFKNKILYGQMFISDHDQYVPKELSLALAQELNFAYTVVPNAGHFLASDGYIEFPQLLDWLRNATEAHD